MLKLALVVQLVAGCGATQHYLATRVAVDVVGGSDGAISPDGKRMVMSSARSGNLDLWVYEFASHRWTQVTDDPADDFEAQWSPDGRTLAFTSSRSGNKDIWTLDLPTRKLRRLTDDHEDDEYPSWSPDGKRIVYTGGPWNRRDFIVVDADGSHRRIVSRSPGKAGACSFDPDGSSLVCHRYDTGTGDVERVELADGAAAPLTADESWDYKPAVSHDGRWLAFSRGGQLPAGIWMMPARGGEARALTAGSGDDRWPTWSRSVDRLLFHRLVERGVKLQAYDRQSGRARTLVGPEYGPLTASPDPSGRHIVFCGDVDGRKRLYRLDRDSGAVAALDTGSGEACFPSWSPDGSQIAFVVYRNRRWELATIDAAGGQPPRVWTESHHEFRNLYGTIDWAPDSRRLVFHADTQPFESDLFVLDRETARIENVTQDSWFDESPSWSADGSSLVFMSTRGGDWTWGLFRLRLADKAVDSVVAPDYVEKNYPRDGRDGDTVFVTHDAHGAAFLAEQSAGERPRVLEGADAGARWPVYSADGRELFYAVVERQIEYWVIDHPSAADSPVWRAPREPRSGPPRSMPPNNAGLLPFRKSPVDHNHR